MKKPVLFLIFNRLDTTEKVFAEIKKAEPPRLYIASDGARKNKEGEKEIVQKTRDFVLKNIDWECEVKTLFREENLGCRKAVSSSITWFFQNEKDGIILEDDCLPNQSFFSFCENLLDYYKDNKKIWHISGDQFVPNFNNGASYYFAKVMHCWGWASWSDRWEKYGKDLKEYNENNLEKFSNNENVKKYWLDILNKMKNNEIDSWAYQWIFRIIENDGLCINPAVNLVSNIGFGENSTHTMDENNPFANLKTYEIEEITHPKKIELNNEAINYVYENVLGINMNWKFYKPYFEYESIFSDYHWPWFGHKFFAYDLVSNLKPKKIVELGTHYGTSLWAFSQATKDQNLDTEINAVDTWEGEKHAGFYGEEVFETVNRIKREIYPGLKINLLRKKFDEAVNDFQDKSIDILHIDGLHTYDAVKNDFETWISKVSDNGVVLFHDIKVKENDFGVYKFWEELKKEYKTIEFHHSFGLGILFKNKNADFKFIEKIDELQMHYYYIYENLKNWKLGERNLVNIGFNKEDLENLKNELNFIKSSKFWKMREVYIKYKNKIKFAIFCPKKIIKKYFKF